MNKTEIYLLKYKKIFKKKSLIVKFSIKNLKFAIFTTIYIANF